MNLIDLDVSGTKDDVLHVIDTQVKQLAISVGLGTSMRNIVEAAPGTHLSLSARMTGDPSQKFGTLSVAGSFWTK